MVGFDLYAQQSLLLAEYQSYDITSHPQSRCCAFFVVILIKKSRIFQKVWNLSEKCVIINDKYIYVQP